MRAADGLGTTPVSSSTGAGLHLMWSWQANLDAQGKPLLEPVHVELLHAAVLKACDGLDGWRDGILDDPRRCEFDPAALACADDAPAPGCLPRPRFPLPAADYDRVKVLRPFP